MQVRRRWRTPGAGQPTLLAGRLNLFCQAFRNACQPGISAIQHTERDRWQPPAEPGCAIRTPPTSVRTPQPHRPVWNTSTRYLLGRWVSLCGGVKPAELKRFREGRL